MNNLFSKNDFLTILQNFKLKNSDFIDKVYVMPENNIKELVFVLQTTIPNFSISIFTSIPRNSNSPRDKGEDAIRFVPLLNKKPYSMLPKVSRVNRTKNWEKNVEKRLLHIKEIILKNKCPECSNLLVFRKNKLNIKFIGCSNFPNCTFTKSFKEN